MSAEGEDNQSGGEDDFPGRMLHQAAIYNNTDFLADLLEGEEARSINERDPFGRTALYTAVTNNSLECARMLLQAGADPNIACGPQCGCMTPLHAAALEDKHTFLALLLNSDAAIDMADASGERALDLAVKNRSQECIHLIMKEIECRESKKQEVEKAFYEACLHGDSSKVKGLAQNISQEDLKKLINNTPDGQNSLLYKVCESSKVDIAEFILSHGAEGQVHPVTGQSPLHAACMAGHAPTAKVILQHYPELVQSPTIDGTLPLHIAAAEGHHQVASLILNFPYPQGMKSIFRDENKDHFYRLGFSVNAKDGRSHSPLHIACMQNHPEIVALLLNFRVKIVKRESFASNNSEVEQEMEESEEEVKGNFLNSSMNATDSPAELESPDVREATEDLYTGVAPLTDKNHFCPVEVDALDLDGRSPLHLAVKGNSLNGFHQVAQLLLENKANANKPIISPSGNSTALMEACISGDVAMMDLLMRYKAQDTDLKVLGAATLSQHSSMAGTLLKYKSFWDSEFKINKQAVIMHHCGHLQATYNTYDSTSTTFPSAPTAINWHALRLPQVEAIWLTEAALLHNSNLRGSHQDLAPFAITRIDISKNNLITLPKEMFSLKSLRLLNVSENQLLSLPGDSSNTEVAVVVFGIGKVGSPNGEPSRPTNTDLQWDLPVLEEVQINKNKLKTLPSSLFKLPSLKRLNASHNEIDRLPFEIWLAPSILEVNLSHNSLRELPLSDLSQPTASSETSSLDGSVDLSAEDQVSYSSSVPSTPKKGSVSTSHGSGSTGSGSGANGSGEGDVTVTQEDTSGLLSPVRTYTENSVEHVNHWEDKLRVRASIGLVDLDGANNGGKVCPIQELNLANNLFDSVPTGLACLAPLLSKLTLAHNRLSHVGALSLYPAALKILDISNNRIFGHVLFECARYDDEQYVERWALRTCYNPSPKKQRSQSSSSGRSTLNSGIVTPSPMSVPPSPRVSLQGVSICSHRSHVCLEQLKTLKIDHNKLNNLTLSVDSGCFSTDLSSSEELQKSPSRTSLRRISGQSDGVSVIGQPQLLYPVLSVLDASDNMMSALPVEISIMSSLTELKLAANKIKELPPEMGLLRKLWNLDLSCNPVDRLLGSLLGEKAKKTAAVLGYLKSIKDEATLYNRMKLMFVGVQGIGKTSLLNQLRREGRSTSSKTNKNWAQRMGHGSMKDKDLKGDNISTVGVDISDLILQRGNKEIIFRTWDFGGQKEYYATHQYFLTKRSLYLVCWRVTDGEKGVLDIMQWLVNIQARAPNSPVIIVGTHLDQINKRRYPPNYLNDLQNLIFDKYRRHSEPEKWGLPRVIGSVEISCKPTLMTRSHISDLVNLICTVAFEEQWPGSKGVKLVEQKVPASYVHLQDVVTMLAEQRKAEGKDPVLHTEQYRILVMSKMEELYSSSFRDIAELNQATQFLHENGVLLHYDDVSLQDVYFLDPQWLCDMMANVVTIREINSLAKSGIMRTEDLRLQFKNAAFKPEDIKTYIIDLLNKFEVALLWDEYNLLIPSLLPAESDLRHGRPYTDIRIPVLGCQLQRPHYGTGEHIVLEGPNTSAMDLHEEGRSTFYVDSSAYTLEQKLDQPSQDDVSTGKEGILENVEDKREVQDGGSCMLKVTNNSNPAVALVRLYLMSYFPSGFWPRLITRLLGDSTLYSLILSLYNLPDVLTTNDDFMRTQGSCPEWKCWQTGVELRYMDVVLARLKEAPRDKPNTFCDYRHCQMVMRQEEVEGGVALLNLNSTSILEVLFPNESITVHFDFNDSDTKPTSTDTGHNESLVIQPSPQVTAGLLAKMVDHIDTLLEDWYPDLGARFVQNSRGMYLITRVVPCTRCMLQQKDRQERDIASTEAWSMVDLSPNDQHPCITEPVYIEKPTPVQQVPRTDDAHAAEGDGCSSEVKVGSAPAGPIAGTWVDSVYNSGFKMVQTVGTLYNRTAEATGILPRLERDQMFVFTVEQCVLAADLNRLSVLRCLRHGLHTSAHDVDPILQLAPDVVFQDIGDQYHIDPDQIWLGQILGRGAFGAVFAGSMVDKRTGQMVDIAMKMLQPVDPGQSATPSQKQQFNAERQRWEKDPMKNACEAYLNARKELSILLALHHDHIVPLLGIALQPLCLVLTLAPQGALSTCLREYRRTGTRLPIIVIQYIIIQVASALAYLHSCQIIYRDLKSENVLVWSIPAPSNIDPMSPVNVKLADYGVSRAVLPSGAKGFAGTPPFIAPEIIQHNGEESYTEKVDCFSFGMFIYELLMLRLPFEEGDSGAAAMANLKGHILSGGRPPVTPKELRYPSHTLDLMTLCWSHDPGDRPSAEQIRDIASGPAFCHLKDIVLMEKDLEAVCACAAPTPHDPDIVGDDLQEATEVQSWTDVWVSSRSPGNHSLGNISVFTYHEQRCIQTKSLSLDGAVLVVSMCLAGQYVWLADSTAIIHIFRHSDYAEVLKFPITTTPNVHVRAMVYGWSEKRVFVVLDTGRLVVCGTSLPANLSTNYTPVRTECPGTGKPIHCLTTRPTNKGSSELWCGQAAGRVSVWNLHTTSMKVVRHPDVMSDTTTVVHLVTDSTTAKNNTAIWSYVYPGTEVYRWDAISRTVVGRLDVSKVIPISDPDVQQVMEGDHISAPKCQVSTMGVVGDELYVATTWGCILIADSMSMKPIIVCRSHSDNTPYIRAIVPLVTGPQTTTTATSKGQMDKSNTAPGLVTVGKGYHSLISTHMGAAFNKADLSGQTVLLSWTTGAWKYDYSRIKNSVT